jgi:hypothetical protein
MEGQQKFEGSTTPSAYDRELETEKATKDRVSIESVLHNPYDKLPQLKQLPPHERIPFLESMIAELSATYEGTSIPLHNENGAEVELLSYLLTMEKALVSLDNIKINNPTPAVYN